MTGNDKGKLPKREYEYPTEVGIIDIIFITITILAGIFVLVQFVKWAWSV